MNIFTKSLPFFFLLEVFASVQNMLIIVSSLVTSPLIPMVGPSLQYFWHSNHGQEIALLMSFALNMGVFNGIQWPSLLS